MTTNFIYPNVISNVLDVCKKHLNGQKNMNDLQTTIQFAESEIVAFEEKDIREFFIDMEGKLELIKFTVDDCNQVTESKKVAAKILEWLEARG